MEYSSSQPAQNNQILMNSLIETWKENKDGFWNKDHWKVKPEPCVVKELK